MRSGARQRLAREALTGHGERRAKLVGRFAEKLRARACRQQGTRHLWHNHPMAKTAAKKRPMPAAFKANAERVAKGEKPVKGKKGAKS
jgi:hypothetical protein